MHQINLLLHGMGNVNATLLTLLERQASLLQQRHQLELRVVGAVDSQGGCWDERGLALTELRHIKQRHGSVARHPQGEASGDAMRLLSRAATPLILIEATPVDLVDGGVGLSAMRRALRGGHAVVTANKAPLVLAFAELTALARQQGVGLAYSATVCGGLPAINMGRYDLAHATVRRLEGILNSTTHYLLTEMEAGNDYATALAEAQAAGIAETDPTLDVSGWDAANKLIILANSVLQQPTGMGDLAVAGIEGIRAETLRAARADGHVIKLVASAEWRGEGYDLTVAPRKLPLSHPLTRLTGHEMGLWLETDINGDIFLSIREEDPTPTAAAMLRDIVLLAKGARAW
ncbi:MAG: hypothetical protein KDD73_07140 [Anaerolineales bacterium]|nr:hypothetical protein [Anaerolineales bacterium]MCB9129084.1 homoserine dehydrogenase [Ardenticatenales bacterium]MCB9172764.1 homoserine dehydrogenase [Ardenticatenales bacterium]